MRSPEGLHHLPHKLFDLSHLSLNISHLYTLFIVCTISFFNLLAKTFPCLALVSVTHRSQLEVVVNLVSNLLVLLLNHIDVRVKHIHVVVQRVVLLLCLDKRCYYFLY